MPARLERTIYWQKPEISADRFALITLLLPKANVTKTEKLPRCDHIDETSLRVHSDDGIFIITEEIFFFMAVQGLKCIVYVGK